MADKMMFKQRLMAGKHFGPDYEATPTEEPVLGPLGQPTGKTKEVYPTKEFKKGDVICSEEDLVKAEPQRYAAVGPPRAREPVAVRRRAEEPRNTAATEDSARGDVPSSGGAGKHGADLSVKNKKPAHGFTREELEAQTKDDLIDLAEQTKTEVHKGWHKAQIIDALMGEGKDDGE